MSDNRIRTSVRGMRGYVPGEQTRDPKILKLNTNENPYPPSPLVGKVLCDLSADSLRLYPDPICRDLREMLAGLHGCSPDQILVGNGSDEVLALCLRAFVERDAEVGFFTPSYSLYPVLAAIEDLSTYEVPLTPDFGWVDPDPQRASLFFITNPNAPTSLQFHRNEVEAFCRKASGVVVLDEAYVDFAPEHGMDLALTLPNVVVTRSLSKSYSLAGIRLGYVVGPQPLIEAMYKIKDSYNVNGVSQMVAQAAVQDRTYFTAMLDQVLATRERVTASLQAMEFQVAKSATNFLWVRPRGLPSVELFERLREADILTRYFPGTVTGDHLRITVGTDAQMDRLLDVVQTIVAK